MRNTSGLRRGGSPGRTPGALNKSTVRLRTFLQQVLREALESPECRARLVKQIKTLSVDVKLLQTLLAYAHGKPVAVLEAEVELSLEAILARAGGFTIPGERSERGRGADSTH